METDLLIVTVTKVETTSVFEVFRAATGKDANPIPIGDKTYHDLGTVNGTRTCLVQSEMGAGGLGSALQTVQKGIEALAPDAVVMVGIAFGVNDKKQAIGDILVARQLIPYDFQKVSTKKSGRGVTDNVILRDDRPHCSPWLFDTFRSAELYWKGQTVRIGSVLTGEKLIDNLEFRDELLDLAPEAIGGEMEGRGLYVACQDKKVDWILVKAISDWGDGNKSRNKGKYQELAGRNAAEFVLHVIQVIGIRKIQKNDAIEAKNSNPTKLESVKANHSSGILLKLHQKEEKDNSYHVDIQLTLEDGIPLDATSEFKYEMSSNDRADLRWYLEEYLKYPMDPAPEIAKRIEDRIAQIGEEIFKLVFESNNDARDLWAVLRDKLDDTKVTIATSVKGAAAIPWELIRDPKTKKPIALRAKSFVRSYSRPVQKAFLPKDTDKIRILLVVCRPGGRMDVPFRSVAGKIVKSLSQDAQTQYELDLLRPPTFSQLATILRKAKNAGRPYHIVHFDGHGAYVDVQKTTFIEVLGNLMPVMLSGPEEGSHGYLIFETNQTEEEGNSEWVDGKKIGDLLVETDVPILVLNACRSAHANFQQRPDPNEETPDFHSQVHAFGSLAQEVMNTGVTGVVAMGYNVYVVTAAQFVADLYTALAQGQSLGDAVSIGRKQLADKPKRAIAFDPIPLQDWSVPVVYEAATVQLFPKPVGTSLRIDLSKTAQTKDDLPSPDIGFYGRDETLLALDRAFDKHRVVLLHAYAGSGKTVTAAEFARWYSQTGGVDNPILFTSFEQYKPLPRVLDTIGQIFGKSLEQIGIQWLALEDDDRRQIALQVLSQIPVLWIWDNIEPINGFPSGAKSAWKTEEQEEIKKFLKDASQTKAKFLLTSRRDEQKWLGGVVKLINLPSMPMQERVQLARAIADKLDKSMSSVKDWESLLDYSQGNPMTLTIIARSAFQKRIQTHEQVSDYIKQLRAGENAFIDEITENRSKSLGASLSYGFEQAFSEDERKVLALLHFFQGFVNVGVLQAMGHPEMEWHLPKLANLQRETFNTILDKAADIGLLTAHGGGYYTIHPALPWFFRALFEDCYQQTVDGRPLTESLSTVHRPSSAQAALRAFVESMGALGDYYANQYEHGNRDVIAPLRSEEPNLLHARSLARQHGWWDGLTRAMQGLHQLYKHTGRRAEWKRLVEEIVPDFVGADDLPLSGREEGWRIVIDYLARLAMETRQWNDAERYTRKKVEFARRRATPLLAHPTELLSAEEKNTLRMLAVSHNQLAKILRDTNKVECIQEFEEDFRLSILIGDDQGASITAINLGNVYFNENFRDLNKADLWAHKSLELRLKSDNQGRAQALTQLGFVAHERYNDAKKEGKAEEELLKHLNAVADYYQQALALLPPDAVDDLAVTHNQLGNVYNDAGDVERALYHYNQCIHYDELAGNQYGAGQARRNIAIVLANNGRLSDALLYARAALRNFESYGGRAKDEEDKTKGLIARIEEHLNHD